SPFAFNLEWELRNEPRDPNRADCRESWPGTQQSTRLSVTPKLLQLLSAGKRWWNFQGHANPSVLTHEDLYVNRGSNDDKDELKNEGRPFFFSAFSCHPNQFSRVQEANPSIGPSLGEDLVLLPKSGAVASW